MSAQGDSLELALFQLVSKITRKAAAMLKMFVLGILSFSGKATAGYPTEVGIRKPLLRQEVSVPVYRGGPGVGRDGWTLEKCLC